MGTVFFNSSSELATVANTFTVSSVATDPTTISLTVTAPDTTATTYTYANSEITRSGAGVYTKDVTCDQAGTWVAQWVGTGTATDTTEVTWEVQETELGRLYCTVEALKSRLAITVTTSDLELHAACFAASRWLEQYCQRTFWRTASGTARTFVPQDWYCLRLPEFCDLVSVSALATDVDGDGAYETTWATSDYQLWPVNPAAAPEQRPYTEIRAVASQRFPCTYPVVATHYDRIQVTGVWGWPAVPRGIKQAAQLLAAELFRRKDAPLGVAGEGEFTVQIGQNQMAKNLANPYRRYAVLVG